MEYKWMALIAIFISSFMGMINMNVVLISLPAIFNGIQIDPLSPNSFQYLLWIIMGYSLVTATLLLSFGRLSDIYGRIKMFRLGVITFTLASILLYLTPSTGDLGAIEIVGLRIFQAVGTALFMANSSAIITDAFPSNELGKAIGLNVVAIMSGQFVGLILGGILATFDWRYVFLMSVPFGLLATIWSFKLKEISIKDVKTKLDIWGNITFIGGITLLLIGVTYGLMPYGSDLMGWNNPWVIASMLIGLILLVLFPFIEKRVESPMFKFDLFKIRMFSYANLAGLLATLARTSVMLVPIILLQGVWLPLHGYSYASTPFWAGVSLIPLTVGIIIVGPISGKLSDKYGPRGIATTGMLISALAFMLLAALPYNFSYIEFGLILLMLGAGTGMFGSPNKASIMGSVPPQNRGVASGMMQTLDNTAIVGSTALFFTILIVGITQGFPSAMANSLTSIGAAQLVPAFSNIPPSGALFSAFLGYSPVDSILSSLPASVVTNIPGGVLNTLQGTTWFPQTFANAFLPAVRESYIIGAILCIIAAILSALRGEKTQHKQSDIKTTNAK
ncbi:MULTISPECIES: MFS transporter [Methanobacterium]|uniref:MFS transporter n=1 Tax=Methanobacterium veterum TaxID=408577 RepID=A0A9E4ZY05_9EURY|nr:MULTISPECIES: MFS transporter [Methanobacterium]MCZ3367336.1 MFS transporter [Methanobacterium veterum]MCZ3373516.1 MFS transporter [Methanobacterium veterum]